MEDEDLEGLSQVQSKLQPNLEVLSEFRTATPCWPDLETLTTSDGESQNTKVVDLFELFTIESKFALFRRSYGRNTKGPEQGELSFEIFFSNI